MVVHVGVSFRRRSRCKARRTETLPLAKTKLKRLERRKKQLLARRGYVAYVAYIYLSLGDSSQWHSVCEEPKLDPLKDSAGRF